MINKTCMGNRTHVPITAITTGLTAAAALPWEECKDGRKEEGHSAVYNNNATC
jgi:hypothetical protein